MQRRIYQSLSLALACGCAGAPSSARPAAHHHTSAVYRSTSELSPVRGAAEDEQLALAIERLAERLGVVLQGDGRLARLAELRAAGSAGEAAHRAELGLFEAQLDSHRLRRESGETWVEVLARELPERVRSARPTHYGLFVTGGANERAVLVLSRRLFQLEPVARRWAVGARARLRGRLAPGLRDPRWQLESPEGARVLPAGTGPAFDVRVPLSTAGRHHAELWARDAKGAVRLARLELHVGAAAKETTSAGDRTSTAELQRELEAELKALRQRRALSPLSRHADLQRLAERSAARAQDTRMDEAQLVRQARAAGVDGGLLLPIVLRGGRRALAQQLSRDDVALTRLENPAVTHFGVGVAGSSNDRAVGVLLLSRLPGAIRTDVAAARLLAQLNQNRGARSAPPLSPDPLLSRVAAETCAAFFAHPERDEAGLVAQANEQVARQALRYSRVEALLAVVSDLDEAAALEPVLAADADKIGIAVIQGTRPDTGPHAIAVTLVLAWSR